MAATRGSLPGRPARGLHPLLVASLNRLVRLSTRGRGPGIDQKCIAMNGGRARVRVERADRRRRPKGGNAPPGLCARMISIISLPAVVAVGGQGALLRHRARIEAAAPDCPPDL